MLKKILINIYFYSQGVILVDEKLQGQQVLDSTLRIKKSYSSTF